MATTISDAMLGGLRQHIVDMASYAEYQMGGSWVRAELNGKTVQRNGAVHITFYVRKQGSAVKATAYRLKDASGNVLASKEEDIPFVTGIDAIMYRFKFSVTVGPSEGA